MWQSRHKSPRNKQFLPDHNMCAVYVSSYPHHQAYSQNRESFSTNGTLLKKARKHNSAHRYRKYMHLQPLITPYHILYYLPYSFIYSIPVRIRLEGLKSLCKKGNVAKLLLQLFPRSFRVNLFAEPSSLMNF